MPFSSVLLNLFFWADRSHCRVLKYHWHLQVLYLGGGGELELFLWNLSLETAASSETVTVARRCQLYCSFSVLLSAVETTRTPQIALAQARWLSSEIICTRVHMPRLLAVATIRGWRLFHSRASDCAATIQGRQLLYFYGKNNSRGKFLLLIFCGFVWSAIFF